MVSVRFGGLAIAVEVLFVRSISCCSTYNGRGRMWAEPVLIRPTRPLKGLFGTYKLRSQDDAWF
jgi:hypothetical protein